MITAVIQARTGSQRLPEKVLADVNGLPMLARQIQRLGFSRHISQVVVATTTLASDDVIEGLCEDWGAVCFRGSELDVLGRVAGYASKLPEHLLVECFGDSPLIDPRIVDIAIEKFISLPAGANVVLNNLKVTYPPGMETLVYGSSTLLLLNSMIGRADSSREHVGSNFRKFPEVFNLHNFEAPQSQRRPEVYLEVDELADLILIRSIWSHFEALKGENEYFSLDEILEFCELNHELTQSNMHVVRRWRSVIES